MLPSQEFIDKTWRDCREFIEDIKAYGVSPSIQMGFAMVQESDNDDSNAFVFLLHGKITDLEAALEGKGLSITEYKGFGIPCYYISKN